MIKDSNNTLDSEVTELLTEKLVVSTSEPKATKEKIVKTASPEFGVTAPKSVKAKPASKAKSAELIKPKTTTKVKSTELIKPKATAKSVVKKVDIATSTTTKAVIEKADLVASTVKAVVKKAEIATPIIKVIKNKHLTDDMLKIMEAKHHDPFSVLGRHAKKELMQITIYLPYAESVRFSHDDSELVRVIDTDFFEASVLPEMLPAHYQLIWLDKSGYRHESYDPYDFGVQLPEFDQYLFAEGKH